MKLDAELTRWLVGNQVNVHLILLAAILNDDDGIQKLEDKEKHSLGEENQSQSPADLYFGKKAEEKAKKTLS